ncbi:MAG: PIN domain-containing protein [Gemmatimonas sp.]|nr:PIN domain-containing protein [Gemmatimonas sp.]
MTYYFLDTTALIYAYVPGCEEVRDIVARSRRDEGGSRVLVCDIAFLEALHFLIARAEKGLYNRELLPEAATRLRGDFDDVSPAYAIVEVSAVISKAYDWMQLYSLTPRSAVTLQAACVSQEILSDAQVCLVTTDEEQYRAADEAGFSVCRPWLLNAEEALPEP